MKRLFIAMALLIGALLIVSGCSGASTSNAQTQQPDQTDSAQSAVIEPEQLISAYDAAQLLGEPVKVGEKTDNAAVGQKIVYYEAQDADSFQSLQISVTQKAFMNNDNSTPLSIYNTTKDAVDETADDRTVNGVGGAYFFGTPGLHILYGDYYLCIAAGNSSDEGVQEILAQSGALACQNLDAILGQ